MACGALQHAHAQHGAQAVTTQLTRHQQAHVLAHAQRQHAHEHAQQAKHADARLGRAVAQLLGRGAQHGRNVGEQQAARRRGVVGREAGRDGADLHGGRGGGGGDGRVVLHVHDSAVTGGGHKGQGEAERARKERHRDAQRDTHNTRGDAKDSSAAAAGRRPLCAGRTWRSRSPYATNTSALTVSSRSLKRPTSGPAAALYTSHTASG